ncbi:MAG TPA: HEAT repeat domain-containing protein [Pirellulales bacterium]|nr:HEAT repeat domain-containing protein [Pirellulales bacterium]
MSYVAKLLAFAAVVLTANLLSAMPGPFHGYRTVDPTGRFYAVVKPLDPETAVGRFGIPVEIWLAERQSGADEVKPGRGRDVAVREGDTVLGRVVLEGAPTAVAVSSTGLGFVAFKVSAWRHDGKDPKKPEYIDDAMVIVASDGTVKFRIPISEVFTAMELEQFPHVICPSDILWYGGCWIDESRHDLILVARDRSHCWRRTASPRKPLFRKVNLDTGKVSRASSEVVVTALNERSLAALELALELAGELRLNDAAPGLQAIMADERHGAAARLRAAVALAELGDTSGADIIADAALESADKFAISNLNLLGEDGASLVRGAVARHGAEVTQEAIGALTSLGSKGVPTLVDLLGNDRDRQGRKVAFEVIAAIGPAASDAIPTLLDILEKAPDDGREEPPLRRMAAAALGNIGPQAKAALPALRRFRNSAKSSADAQRVEAKRRGDNPPKIDQTDYFSAAQAIKKIENRTRR